jgi:hypothetical protein
MDNFMDNTREYEQGQGQEQGQGNNPDDIVTKVMNNEPANKLAVEIIDFLEEKLNKKMTIREILQMPRNDFYDMVRNPNVTE